jgi:D-aminopeptidase
MSDAKIPEKKTGVAALDDLFQALNRSDAPGLVVGVAQHGKTIYRRGFGLASIEHAVANTPWTRMRIGSTSKHFTCLAALLLAEEGKLDIDAGVRSYLPDLPALRAEPTLRQFMNHTSGYRCFLDLGFLAEGLAIKPKGVALAVQLRQADANFAPGEKMMYCNGGYHLLSLIIQQVSGLPFEQFLKERIFTPLGMVDTFSMQSDFEIHPGLATLHEPVPAARGGGWRRGIFECEDMRGEGAMVSTVDDMLTWLAHLRAPQKRVGQAASWSQLTALTTLNNGLVNPYGLGLMRHPYRGVEVIHHAGGVTGGSCQMLTVPSHALDIIVIVNGAPANPMDLANKIVDALLGDALPGAAPARPSAARFNPMLGTRYHAPASGVVFGFADAGEDQLGLNFLSHSPVPLRDEGQVLSVGFQDLAVGPLVLPVAELAIDGQEAPATLTLSEGGNAETFERLPATPPALAEAGAALLGRYHAPDLDADARVFFSGSQLLLDVLGNHGRHTMVLEAFSDDVFGLQIGNAHPPMDGTLRVERTAGRVSAFHINTLRTRHMRFERLAD